MSTIDNIAAKLTKVEIQYLINNPDKLANIWNDLQVPKKQLECKVGDCFYTKDCVGNLSLIKIIDIEEYNGWFICDEICIEVDEFDHTEVDYFDVNYPVDDTLDWVSINASLYENVLTLVNSREDAVTKVLEQFNSQIRQLCQEVNQNQEK